MTKWRVGSVTVGGIGAGNHIGQSAVFFKLGEFEQYAPDFFHHSGSYHSACADKCIASPVKEPWIAGNHRL